MKHDRVITTKDLSEQYFYRDGEIIGFTTKPINSFEEIFMELLSTQNRLTIGYDNVDVVCPSTQNKFSICSLEEFLLMKHLSENLPEGEKQTFVDIGCGSGFMGNYFGKNFKQAKGGEVVFADIQDEATQVSLSAYIYNNPPEDGELTVSKISPIELMLCDMKGVNVRSITGNVLETLKDRKADIAVAAPSYIPHLAVGYDGAYQDFIQAAKMLGATLYIVHSNLTDNILMDVKKEAGGKIEEVESKEFELFLDFSDNEILREVRQLGLKVYDERYFHRLKVSQITF